MARRELDDGAKRVAGGCLQRHRLVAFGDRLTRRDLRGIEEPNDRLQALSVNANGLVVRQVNDVPR
jgi:hypothetical protein